MLKLASIGLIELASNRYTRVAIPTRENLERELRAPRRLRRGRRARHIDADSYARRDGATRPHRRHERDGRRRLEDEDLAAFRAGPLRPGCAQQPSLQTVDVMGPQVERVIFNALIALDDDLWDSAEQAGDCAKRSRRATRKPRPACCTTSKTSSGAHRPLQRLRRPSPGRGRHEGWKRLACWLQLRALTRRQRLREGTFAGGASCSPRRGMPGGRRPSSSRCIDRSMTDAYVARRDAVIFDVDGTLRGRRADPALPASGPRLPRLRCLPPRVPCLRNPHMTWWALRGRCTTLGRRARRHPRDGAATSVHARVADQARRPVRGALHARRRRSTAGR